jgi:hypothetical protein
MIRPLLIGFKYLANGLSLDSSTEEKTGPLSCADRPEGWRIYDSIKSAFFGSGNVRR